MKVGIKSETITIPMLEVFLEFSIKMKKLKKKFHDKLDNQFMSKFAYFSSLSGLFVSLFSIRFLIHEDYNGKRELSDFVISTQIFLSILTISVVLCPAAKKNKIGKIICEYEETIKKIITKISEIEQEESNHTQGIEETLQRYVEAAVGEGKAPESQKKRLDNLFKEERKISPTVKRVLFNLFLDAMNKSNRPEPTESWIRAQKRWKDAFNKIIIDDGKNKKDDVNETGSEDMQNKKEYEAITRL